MLLNFSGLRALVTGQGKMGVSEAGGVCEGPRLENKVARPRASQAHAGACKSLCA